MSVSALGSGSAKETWKFMLFAKWVKRPCCPRGELAHRGKPLALILFFPGKEIATICHPTSLQGGNKVFV